MRWLWLMNSGRRNDGGRSRRPIRRLETIDGQRSAFDWPMYRHDQAGTGYSPLTQIDARNVASLTQAWTYRLQSDAPAPPPPAGGAAPAA